VIDLHCHILPGIDDGPPTLDDALALARAQVDAGVRTVIATPHVTWDLPRNDAATIRAAVDELSAQLRAAEIDLDVRAGAELAITRAAELDDDELRALAIGGGPWLLVESPLTTGATGFDAILSHLQMRGHRLVLAHPERCPAFQRDPELLSRLVHGGMLTSLTAGAFVGRFGETVRRFALGLVREGLVHTVASDAHDVTRRPPGIAGELDEAGLGEWHAWWTQAMPHAVLTGSALPAPPLVSAPPPRQGGLLGRLRGR
jgi:protein-tyrosine phosphatase